MPGRPAGPAALGLGEHLDCDSPPVRSAATVHECCRASTAVEKALGESVQAATCWTQLGLRWLRRWVFRHTPLSGPGGVRSDSSMDAAEVLGPRSASLEDAGKRRRPIVGSGQVRRNGHRVDGEATPVACELRSRHPRARRSRRTHTCVERPGSTPHITKPTTSSPTRTARAPWEAPVGAQSQVVGHGRNEVLLRLLDLQRRAGSPVVCPTSSDHRARLVHHGRHRVGAAAAPLTGVGRDRSWRAR